MLLMTIKKIISVHLKFKHNSPDKQSFIFPNIKYVHIDKGIPELLKYLSNNGFTIFGLEVRTS